MIALASRQTLAGWSFFLLVTGPAPVTPVIDSSDPKGSEGGSGRPSPAGVPHQMRAGPQFSRHASRSLGNQRPALSLRAEDPTISSSR